MHHLSIKLRLTLGYSFMTLLLALVAVTGMWSESATQANLDNQINRLNRLSQLGNELLDAANMRAVSARNLVIATSANDIEAQQSRIMAAHQKVTSKLKDLEEYPQIASDTSTKLRDLIALVAKTESMYGPVALEITKLGSSGQQALAIKMINEQCRPLLDELIGRIDTLLAEIEHIGKVSGAKSEAQFESTRRISFALTLLAIGTSLILAVSTTRSIAQPLEEAAVATAMIAKGNLAQPIEVRGRNEISTVLATMETMRQSLAALVGEVRHGAETVSNASFEIAAGNQDLSGRTEQQASALQQTAASMEQLNSAVKQNAENAQHAKQLALQAAKVAKEGEIAAKQVAETMREISESSSRIHDIVSVIDSIAFQTNILALNAAVEAARAGEQGRGFAVVAGEVRVLANRSAASAKEIRALVANSTQQVGRGAHLVSHAGQTMQDIVSSIHRVDEILGEISAASVEQSSGVSQVGEAITIMDQATQQNSALVEQMSAAAAGLQGQASELVRTVATFEIDEQSQAPIANTSQFQNQSAGIGTLSRAALT